MDKTICKGQMDRYICLIINRQKDKVTKRQTGQKDKSTKEQKDKKNNYEKGPKDEWAEGYVKEVKYKIFSAASTSSSTLASQESSRGVLSLC